MFVHALSGAASFAACLRLFRSYPLAVSSQSSGWHRSMVLRHRTADGTGFYVLTQDPAQHFTLRAWDPHGIRYPEILCAEIRPEAPVPAASHQVITEGMPVPRDGALLGWVSDRQAAVLLSVYHGQPGGRPGTPQVRALAMVGSEPLQWPPFTAEPLDDGRLWDYVERGEIVDLTAVIRRSAGSAYWVPSQNPGRASQGHGCVVVTDCLPAEEFWIPVGIYMDHWMLREGVPTPSARHLLSLPGTEDLASRMTGRPLPGLL